MEVTKIGQSPSVINNVQDKKEISLKRSDFGEFLENKMNEVNEKHIDANNKVESMIKGEDVSMHEVMLSAQEAQMSMQLLIEVRNKIYDAYQEMNKVQI